MFHFVLLSLWAIAFFIFRVEVFARAENDTLDSADDHHDHYQGYGPKELLYLELLLRNLGHNRLLVLADLSFSEIVLEAHGPEIPLGLTGYAGVGLSWSLLTFHALGLLRIFDTYL